MGGFTPFYLPETADNLKNRASVPQGSAVKFDKKILKNKVIYCVNENSSILYKYILTTMVVRKSEGVHNKIA